jgi:hypothetical protein
MLIICGNAIEGMLKKRLKTSWILWGQEAAPSCAIPAKRK